MQAAGFVERRPDPKDRRAWRLYTTAQASDVIDDMEHIARELRRECTVGVTYEELEQAMNVMTRIKENLQALDTVEPSVEPAKEEG